MAARRSGLVEEFLASADVAAQVAFVGKAEVAIDRRRDIVAALRPEPRRLGMKVPKRDHRPHKGRLPRHQIERKIDFVTTAIGIRVRVV